MTTYQEVNDQKAVSSRAIDRLEATKKLAKLSDEIATNSRLIEGLLSEISNLDSNLANRRMKGQTLEREYDDLLKQITNETFPEFKPKGWTDPEHKE